MAMQGMQGAQGQQGAQAPTMAPPRIDIQEFENKLDALPDSALKRLAQDPKYMTNAMYGPLINAELTRRVSARQSQQTQQAQQGQQPTVVQQAQQAAQQLPEDTGIAQLPAQNIANMAGGGIVAFASGGDMEDGEVEYDPSMDIQQEDEDVIALGGEGAGGMEQIPQPQKILKDATTPIGRQVQKFFLGDIKPPSNEERLRELLFSKIRQEYEPRSGLRGKFSSQSESEYQRANDIMAQAEALRKRGDVEGLQTMVGELFNPDAARVTGAATTPGRVVPGFKPEAAATAAPRGPAAPSTPAAGAATPAAAAAAAQQGLGATDAARSYADYIREGMDLIKGMKPDYSAVREQEAKERRGIEALTRQAAANADTERQELLESIRKRGEYGKGREERLAKQEEGLTKRREEAQGMALFQAGMAILAAPPGRGAMAALGIGAQSGLKMYQSDVKELQAAADKIQAARDALEDIRYKEQTADDAQLRSLSAKKRQIELEGGKELHKISSRYGYELSMNEANATFKAAVDAQRFGVEAGLGLAKLTGAERIEGMEQSGLLKRAGLMAAGRAGKGPKDEYENLRREANKVWVDPYKQLAAVSMARSAGYKGPLDTLDDFLRYKGIPVGPSSPSAQGKGSGSATTYDFNKLINRDQ